MIKVSMIDYVLIKAIQWLAMIAVLCGCAWWFAYLFDRALTYWLKLIKAWPVVIEVMRKRYSKGEEK